MLLFIGGPWFSTAAFGQLGIDAVGVPVLQNFDIPGTVSCTAHLPWVNNGTIPATYSDQATYNHSNGCANIGGLHLAGATGEMALGGRGSNSTPHVRWGVRFKNNTGVALSSLHISLRSEQWGQAQSNLVNNVTPFSYRTSPSPITDVVSGTWLTNTTWDLVSFTAPTGCGGANTTIDGNAPANSQMQEGCLNVFLAPGDEIMLRWYDSNDPCNDHMLCVDDLSVTGNPAPVLFADGPTTFCAGDSVTLSVMDPTDVTWSTGETTGSITVYEGGTYTATYVTACGELVLSQEVVVHDASSATITTDGLPSLCPGGTLQLTASTGTGFLWSTGETTPTIDVDMPGTYSVEVTGACGTVGADIEVTAAEGPVASITPEGPTELCPNSSVALIASGGETFTWSTGADTPMITIHTEGSWTVTVSNACGSDTATIQSTVIHLPIAAIDASSSTLCPNDQVMLTATGGDSYLWSTGESDAVIAISSPGTYAVVVSNACGSGTASETIVASTLIAAFAPSPLSGTAPLELVFNNESVSSGPSSWDLGIDVSSEYSPTATYTDPGTYQVVLTVTDPLTGCVDNAIAYITVDPGNSWITVPNVFTPNGDGMNDVFAIRQEGIMDFDCSIMNRWGKEVGRLTDANSHWNGKLQGESLPDGVYFYVLHARGSDQREYDLTGQVTLLR